MSVSGCLPLRHGLTSHPAPPTACEAKRGGRDKAGATAGQGRESERRPRTGKLYAEKVTARKGRESDREVVGAEGGHLVVASACAPLACRRRTAQKQVIQIQLCLGSFTPLRLAQALIYAWVTLRLYAWVKH